MRLVPLQWASLVVIALDTIVILSGLVTGSALLPRSANLVLTVISVALMFAVLALMRGGFNFEKPTLPAWSIAVAVIAFFGGVFLFAYPLVTNSTAGDFEERDGKYQETRNGVVRELTREQYDSVVAVNQRGWAGLSLAFGGLTLAYAGIRHRR
ncbi:hypothetical protein [Lentzea sp. NPDC055074]